MSRNAAAQAQQAPQDVLAGIVKRVTSHNDENGFCVLGVKARGRWFVGAIFESETMIGSSSVPAT